MLEREHVKAPIGKVPPLSADLVLLSNAIASRHGPTLNTNEALLQVFLDACGGKYDQLPLSLQAHIVLEALLTKTTSADFDSSLKGWTFGPDKTKEILREPIVTSTILSLLESPKDFSFTLGAYFSQIPLDKLPETVREKVAYLQTRANVTLETAHKEWRLCLSAEPKLHTSLKDGAAIVISEDESPLLVVKFNGRLAGVCVQTFEGQGGHLFIEGNWYAPTDRKTRAALRRSFDRGVMRLPTTTSNWTLLRALQEPDISNLPTQLLKFSQEAPEVSPHKTIYGISRRDYRRQFAEAFVGLY